MPEYRTERIDPYDPDGDRVLAQWIEHVSPNGTPYSSRVYVARLEQLRMQRRTWDEVRHDGWRRPVDAAVRQPHLQIVKRQVRGSAR